MRKDVYRDYATAAFMLYASMGCPSCDYFPPGTDAARREDLLAVKKTLEFFQVQGREDVIGALKGVYFSLPEIPRKGDVARLVTQFAVKNAVDERSVYRYLSRARRVFIKFRTKRTNIER